MAIAPIELIPAPPALAPAIGPDLADVLREVTALLESAADVPTARLDDEGLGQAIAVLASVESRAAAFRMSLSAEADRRRVAEQTAETGTDAWVARLTGSTREAAAGGLRIARLLSEKYAATQSPDRPTHHPGTRGGGRLG